MLLTFLTFQTTKSLKSKIYNGNRCDNLVKCLKAYQSGIESIEISAKDGLNFTSCSLQTDLGACIIALKDSKSLLSRQHQRKLNSIDRQYQLIIKNLSIQKSGNDIDREIMELCQKTKNLVNDIILKLESEKI